MTPAGYWWYRLGVVTTSDTPLSPQDAMRSVTKQAVKEARLREIKDELLNSEKLKVMSPQFPGGHTKQRGVFQGAATPPILCPQGVF